jgi:hypothetical protein
VLLQQEKNIPGVDDKSIMFFKKGLRDSSFIHKLTMKNPMTSEDMLVIINKYVLVEEATLDTRDRKKGSASTLKSNDKKRKSDHFVANVERLRHNQECQP